MKIQINNITMSDKNIVDDIKKCFRSNNEVDFARCVLEKANNFMLVRYS